MKKIHFNWNIIHNFWQNIMTNLTIHLLIQLFLWLKHIGPCNNNKKKVKRHFIWVYKLEWFNVIFELPLKLFSGDGELAANDKSNAHSISRKSFCFLFLFFLTLLFNQTAKFKLWMKENFRIFRLYKILAIKYGIDGNLSVYTFYQFDDKDINFAHSLFHYDSRFCYHFKCVIYNMQ